MKRRPYYMVALATVVFAAHIASVGGTTPVAADANGDSRADVLDVQVIVAQILAASAGSAASADVNHDGRVDVLDFQQTLAETAQTAPPSKPLPENRRPDAVFPVTIQGLALAALPERLSAHLATPAPKPCPRGALRDSGAAIPKETERWLFSLTPHAPPLA